MHGVTGPGEGGVPDAALCVAVIRTPPLVGGIHDVRHYYICFYMLKRQSRLGGALCAPRGRPADAFFLGAGSARSSLPNIGGAVRGFRQHPLRPSCKT